MYQQVNFYRTEFLSRKDRLGAGALMAFGGVLIVGMIAAYLYATYEMMSVKSKLKTAEGQERAAITRLENFDPNAEAGGGQTSWEQQLEQAKLALRDQELILPLRLVRDEGVHFLRQRGQADEVEVKPANQRVGIRRR